MSNPTSGTWTPTFTFRTPGDLQIEYFARQGRWWRHDSLVHVNFIIGTSSFIHSTASGQAVIRGLPFTIEGGGEGFNVLGGDYWPKPGFQYYVDAVGAYNEIALRGHGTEVSAATLPSRARATPAHPAIGDPVGDYIFYSDVSYFTDAPE